MGIDLWPIMKFKHEEGVGREIFYAPEVGDPQLGPEDVEHVCEIFQTPLTGAYNWDYRIQDSRIHRLYELGKELNWNASTDIDWDRPFPKDESPIRPETNDLANYPGYMEMSPERQLEFIWHSHAWTQSQFLHGEQGALLVASQLVSCAPTYAAKLYAASQTFDEARHVEVYNRYLQQQVGFMWPINKHLKSLIDKVLTDERWDLKFIGMQIIIEGLALAAFNMGKASTRDPLLYDIIHYVIRDEARHVTFGVNYLEEYVTTLSEEEIEDRAQFSYEACQVMRERLLPLEVHEYFGLNTEETRAHVQEGSSMSEFRKMLFSRVMPNLKRIGLLTERIRPKFEEMGLLEYEQQPSDWEIDWSTMSKPLETKDDLAEERIQMDEHMKQIAAGTAAGGGA